jgi:hypothetical protein
MLIRICQNIGIVLVAVITSIIADNKIMKWTTENLSWELQYLLKIAFPIIIIIIKISIKCYLLFYFPLLFVSWVLVTDPALHYIIYKVFEKYPPPPELEKKQLII